jgi:hypothetical protein
MHPMDDAEEMQKEIQHLRTLAAVNTNAKVLTEIQMLIDELERRIREGGNGHSASYLPPLIGEVRAMVVWYIGGR